jgi:hypothetical protein
MGTATEEVKDKVNDDEEEDGSEDSEEEDEEEAELSAEELQQQSLQERPVSPISELAYNERWRVPLPHISIKWISPLRNQTFYSRTKAWDYATQLCQQEVQIDKMLSGVGARGQLLQVNPTRAAIMFRGKPCCRPARCDLNEMDCGWSDKKKLGKWSDCSSNNNSKQRRSNRHHHHRRMSRVALL